MENVDDIYPLTPVQQGILAECVREPHSFAYHVQFSCTIDCSDDASGDAFATRFADRWGDAFTRHEILRSMIVWEAAAEPLQIVRSRVDLPWRASDWRSAEHSEQHTRWAALLHEDLSAPFDLQQAPLARLHLVRVNDRRYRFLWSFHHIILDGWSTLLLLQEVFGESRRSNARFRDFVAWSLDDARTPLPSESIEFWKQQLQGFDTPTFVPREWGQSTVHSEPLYTLEDAPIDAPETFDPDSRIALRFSIEPSDVNVAEFAASNRLTVNTIVMAAWAIVLGYLNRTNDVVFGATLSGRPTDLPDSTQIAGLMITTVPVRAQIDPRSHVVDWLHQIQANLLAVQTHQFSHLIDIQRQADIDPTEPLFESLIVSHAFPSSLGLGAGASAVVSDISYEEYSHYPLALLWSCDARFEAELLCSAGRVSETSARSLQQLFETALTSIVKSGGQVPIEALPVMPHSLESAVQRWETAPADEQLLATSTVWESIESCFADHPDRTAIQSDQVSVSYSELGERVSTLASTYVQLGVRSGDVVAIAMPNSENAIAAMLASWKCGATYVVVHDESPETRIRTIVERTGCVLAIGRGSLAGVLQGLDTAILTIDDSIWSRPIGDAPPSTTFDGNDIAYILFTSGSSGDPKGVKISHRNLAFSNNARSEYYGGAPERFLLLSSNAFDSSVAGIFSCLTTGATLVVADADQRRDPAALADLIARHRVTHTLCIPALYDAILTIADDGQLDSLQSVIVAGEPCSSDIVRHHFRATENVDLFNEYGPTEATVWCSVAQLFAQDANADRIPIGRPIPGAELRVVDQHGRRLPPFTPGALWVAGPGVAKGYLDPDDDWRFVTRDGNRFYQTGDNAYWDSDGNLHLVGRADRQIKIRGHRIELGEIEAVATELSNVDEAVAWVATDAPDPESVQQLALRVASSEYGMSILEEIENRDAFAAKHEGTKLVKKRTSPHYDIQLGLDNVFIQPPRKSQRDWLVRQLLDEFEADLAQADTHARRFKRGRESRLRDQYPDIESAELTDQEIMETWQEPLMNAMAEYAASRGGDILEIGFGRGYAATAVQLHTPASHTIVEVNDFIIADHYYPWRRQHSIANIQLITGRWQDNLPDLTTYDGILFHAFPLNEEEFVQHVLSSATYAEHAFSEMARLLKPNGVFTYLTTEIDSLSRRHQRALLQCFDEITFKVLPVEVPDDTQDAWWADSMVVLAAKRRS